MAPNKERCGWRFYYIRKEVQDAYYNFLVLYSSHFHLLSQPAKAKIGRVGFTPHKLTVNALFYIQTQLFCRKYQSEPKYLILKFSSRASGEQVKHQRKQGSLNRTPR